MQIYKNIVCKVTYDTRLKFFLIVECPIGSYGENCSQNCPDEKYGEFCLQQCNCTTNQRCNFMFGCLGIVFDYVLF